MEQRTAAVSSFEELVHRYAQLIRAVVGRVAGKEALVVGEDVEEVLVALWKATSGEQEIRHPTSYVYRAAVRETVRVLRKEHQRRERTVDLSMESDRTVRTPEELMGGKELGVGIVGCLKVLSADRRRAVKAHLAGFSVKEIMEMFDWPYNKARNLIARGMADLRRELQARGIDG